MHAAHYTRLASLFRRNIPAIANRYRTTKVGDDAHWAAYAAIGCVYCHPASMVTTMATSEAGHHSRENRLPPVQPRHHREPHLQSAAIKKRIGSRCEHGAGTACFPFLIPSHKNAWFISRTKPGIMLRVSAFKNICCQLMKVVFWYCKFVAQQIFEKQCYGLLHAKCPPHSSTQIRSARALGPFPVALAAPITV